MQVSQDVFPAIILVTTPEFPTPANELSAAPPTKGDGAYQVNTARVVVSNNRILIARDSNEGPVIVFNEAIDPLSYYKNPDRKGTSYLVTESGKKIAFVKDSSCGCGSRLRSWSPYGFMTSVKDPG